jgi:hypothetical protein
MFFRLDTSQPPRQFKYIFRESNNYSAERIPCKEDLVVDGYFQSWKHFHHQRDQILSTFAPSDFTMNMLRSKYGALLDHPKTVSIHIRTSGIRFHNTNQQPFLGFEYYDKAMSLFPDDSVFVVFSDRINWCRKKFTERFSKNFVFVEGNYGIEDLFLMSTCKHNIICNSTFSWWGAYLNQNPECKVIVPDQWRSGELPHPKPFEDLYLPGWVGVPYIYGPYPEDMYAFDESSKSCDPVWWN